MPLLLIILFLIWLFGSLPLILYLMYHQKKYAFYFFALFLALIAMYYPPVGDQYRYWHNFAEPFSLEDVLDIPLSYRLPFLSLIYPLIAIAKNSGENLEHVRLFLLLLCYGLSIHFFWDITTECRQNVSRQKYFLGALLFMMSIPFCTIIAGFRWGTATVLFFLAASYFIIGRKKQAIFLAAASCLFHFAIIPLFFLFCGCFYFKNFIWQHKNIILLTAVVTFFSLELLIPGILQIPFLNFLAQYLDPEGIWRTGELPWEISVLNKIGTVVINIVFYFFIALVLSIIYKYSRQNKNDVASFSGSIFFLTLILTVLFILFHDFHTISGRLKSLIFLFATTGIVVSKLKGNLRISHNAYMAYAFLITVFFFFSFLALRKNFYYADAHRFFYANFYTAVTNTYTTEWVDRNVLEGGHIRQEK